MYHIYVVEDHPGERRELAMLLQNALYQVTAPETFEQIREEIKKLQPDLVLMDIELPGTDGLRLCREIRLDSQIPVIFLTGRDNPMDELSGLLTGGDDYITKPFGMMEFVARIKAVLRRTNRNSNTDKELKCGDLRILVGRHEVFWKDEKIELTRKEFELLVYLVENRGLVMSRNQILCQDMNSRERPGLWMYMCEVCGRNWEKQEIWWKL